MCAFIEGMVQDLGHGQQKQHLLLVPRGTFKTTLGAVALPLWLLTKDPNLRILITSHTHEYSKQILDEIKFHCTNNPTFKELYGDWSTGAAQWSDEAVVVAARTEAKKEPSIDTAGVDRSKTGGHYDVIIGDDLHSERNIDTEGLRRKVRRHIQTLRPILEPSGAILLIGTRWHPDDAYGHILRREEERKEKFKDKYIPTWHTLVRAAYLLDGTLYFPSRLTEEFLAQQKDNLESKFYAVWYENQPLEEGSLIFPRSWWRYWDGEFYALPTPTVRFANGETQPLFVTAALDPAISSARRSDYSGLTVVGTTPDDLWVVLDARRVRGGPAILLPELAYMLRRYHPAILSIETVGFQQMLKDWVLERLASMNIKVGIHEYRESTRRSKGARIEALQPRFRQGKILLRRGLTPLYQELSEYPEPTHDDLLDSLAQHAAVSRPARIADLNKFDDDPFSPLNRKKEGQSQDRGDGTWIGRGSLRA
jgi:predicted phage terminase large subunit-like protein